MNIKSVIFWAIFIIAMIVIHKRVIMKAMNHSKKTPAVVTTSAIK